MLMKQRKGVVKSCVCAFSLATLTGCLFPHTTERSPVIHGRLLDANTRAPIQHAKVFLTEHPKVSCKSDAEGRFRLKATHHFHLIFVPAGEGGHWPSGGIDWAPYVTVSHSNYVPSEVRGFSSDKGDVLLKVKQ
jgi:hypothetical protein